MIPRSVDQLFFGNGRGAKNASTRRGFSTMIFWRASSLTPLAFSAVISELEM